MRRAASALGVQPTREEGSATPGGTPNGGPGGAPGTQEDEAQSTPMPLSLNPTLSRSMSDLTDPTAKQVGARHSANF